MAIEKKTYPVIPLSRWWAIRKRLKQSVPSSITPTLLSTILQMKESSVRANILPGLISCGLIDAKGKPTDRAIRWRDDEQYKKVCEEIREQIYPEELRDAVPGPTPSQEDAVRWFATKLRVGQAAAQRFAGFYILVTEADVSKAPKHKGAKAATVKRTAAKSTGRRPPSEISKQQSAGAPGAPEKPHEGPSLHIDIQVHISPESTPDQIDQIFAAMEKHIFKR